MADLLSSWVDVRWECAASCAEWWSFMAVALDGGRIGGQLKRPAGAARPTDQSTIPAAWEDHARGLV